MKQDHLTQNSRGMTCIVATSKKGKKSSCHQELQGQISPSASNTATIPCYKSCLHLLQPKESQSINYKMAQVTVSMDSSACLPLGRAVLELFKAGSRFGCLMEQHVCCTILTKECGTLKAPSCTSMRHAPIQDRCNACS